MFSKMIKTAAAAFLLTQTSAVFAAPSSVSIRSISFAGSGCPAGSISGRMGRDFNAFSLLLDGFVAETGPGIPLAAKRKNCSISVALNVPAGWSFSIAEVEYRGFIDLDRGVTAQQKSSYYFQGQSDTASLSTTLTGPRRASYRIKDVLGIESQVWSPCGAGRNLNINAQVLLNSSNRNAYGLITLDRINGGVEQVYGLKWKRC